MEAGRVYHLADQYPRAADCFAKVLEALADPKKYGLEEESIKLVLGDPGPTYNLMGQCFLMAGRPKEAQAAMEKSNQVAPNPGLYGLNLARLDQRSGRPREALDHLQACFDAHLASEAVRPYRLLRELLESLKLSNELLSRLEKLHAADPANVPLAYYLADQYLERKQYDKAEPLYRALVAKTPSGVGLRSLVAIYRQTKKPEALLEVLGELTGKSGALDTLGEEGRALESDTATIGACWTRRRRSSRATRRSSLTASGWRPPCWRWMPSGTTTPARCSRRPSGPSPIRSRKSCSPGAWVC